MSFGPSPAGEGFSHGKIILIGEHSVVYGKPAIAFPFPSVSVKTRVRPSPEGHRLKCDYFTGFLEKAPRELAGIRAVIFTALDRLNKGDIGLEFEIESTIPVGRGLGSSAAVAVSVVRGLFDFFGLRPDRKELLDLVHLSETYAHGHPSGIDGASCAGDAPIWFVKGKSPASLGISVPFYLVVADTGRPADTRSAVGSVRRRLETDPESTMSLMEGLESLTYKTLHALSSGRFDEVGRAMNAAHQILKDLGVSDAGLDRLTEVAQRAGALGAKLTGGGRGGCLICLSDEGESAKKIASSLEWAGARKAWIYRVPANRGKEGKDSR
jgi:mevalonate kinase